ncbi:hypothetical protein NGTWS0302_20030 [Mycolicibacterium cyprinidarum]|uniref:Uncharacterized protein n=1 Tax=Mycolicibacterium cyprinidarum TaxID=2860311 RepID=A0ABQ4V7T4_9MYCO|nr:hypothetical protein NGTWS1702_09690 [Mycolicibacterium sp. NGTWSNA01]GJF20533.1 hypothetical protein NGTWS0302_20030 [Mycolicibacterium sp. NGTWS0302]
MLGLSLAMVIAVVIGLLVWKATSNHGPGAETTTPASDGVDRTVGLLREKDPVCDDWGKYADELAEQEERWAALNKGVPAAEWTPKQHEIFDSVGEAMITAADRFEAILPKTRNVVLQELIAQTISYLRAYVDRIPIYVESDGFIAGVANNFGGAVTYMCNAVPIVPAPSDEQEQMLSAAPDASSLAPFMADKDPVCPKFQALIERQRAQLGGWMAGNSMKSAAQWTPKEEALNAAAREVLNRDSEKLFELGKSADNPIVSDLMLTQAAYMQAFSEVLPNYTPDDAQLWTTVTYLGGGLSSACKAQL